MIRLTTVLALLLSGCSLSTPPVPPPSDVRSAPLLGAAEGTRGSKAAAAVEAAKVANDQNPLGAPRDAVAGELSVASANLPAPTDKDRAEALSRANAALSGRLADAEQLWTKARLDAADLRARILELEERVKSEREKAAADLQRQLQEARDAVKNEVMREQVAALNKWGASLTGIAIVAFGLAAVFGGISGVRMVGPLAAFVGLCGLACFGLAQIVSQPWFMWAVLGVVLLAFALVAWWVVAKYRAGTLKEKLEQRAAKLDSTIKQVIPVLDKAYDNASDDAKRLLDETIFSPLSARMDASHKAVIHEVRSELKTPTQ